MRKRVWLLAFVLGACSHTHGPQDSTQTGNPPLLDEGLLTLEVSTGEVHITGRPGAVSPGGAAIAITNLSTGEVIEGTADADGSFDVRVDGSPDDAFAVRAVADDESSVPVYVARGGAAIAGEADGSLSCDQYRELMGAVLDGSAAAADVRCESDLDCVSVPLTSSCYFNCEFAHVANAGMNQIEAAAQNLDDGLCVAYLEQGCVSPIFHCPFEGGNRCVAGKCEDSSMPLSCEERIDQASSTVAAALAKADTACEADRDCAATWPGSNCTGACSETAVSLSGKAQFEAVTDEVNSGLCASVFADECPITGVPCPAPLPTEPRCQMGQCALVPIATDGGIPDCVTCFSETLKWGPNGGLVDMFDVSELAPCARYRHVRHLSEDPLTDALACERDLVACNSSASTGAVMSALSNQEVQSALAQSPILYGRDARPVDGQVFEIELGSQIIDVGDACDGSATDCVSTPAGVQDLVDLLKAIDQQMLMTDECAAFN